MPGRFLVVHKVIDNIMVPMCSHEKISLLVAGFQIEKSKLIYINSFDINSFLRKQIPHTNGSLLFQQVFLYMGAYLLTYKLSHRLLV